MGRLIVDREVLADDRRVGLELTPPHRVGEKQRARSPRLELLFDKIAAEHRGHAKHTDEVFGNRCRRHLPRFVWKTDRELA